MFRKEIKKWNTIWWFVLASLGLSGISFVFFAGKSGKDGIKVASVNETIVSLKDYHSAFAEIKASLDDYAAMFGVPAEQLAMMMGMQSLEQSALDQCIQGKLVNGIVSDLSINLDAKKFEDSLGASISRQFVDRSGQINMQAYQNYLSRLHLTVTEYEEKKEEEFKQILARKFITASDYVPEYAIKSLRENMNVEKKFVFLELSSEDFLQQAKKEKVAAKELEKYFTNNKERYRIAEKRKGMFWSATPEDYAKKIDVDNRSIQNFYDKYKSSLFRIPPKVKVRRILLRVNENVSPDVMQGVRTKIESILKEAKEKPSQFAALAKRHSQDQKTSKSGGLLDYFSRGTHDPALEKVAFVSLKEKGDLSDVISTKEGLEILILEDRISANVKPLNDVREEIIKKVREKKALMSLRSDMSKVIRESRKDKKAIEMFAEESKLKSEKTKMSTKSDSSGYSLEGMVVQKLFNDRKQIREQGYFVHRGQHVLYVLTDQEKSYIPKLATIKNKVENDWYSKKAKKLQKDILRTFRRDLISKKANIFELGQKEGAKLIITKFIKSDGKVDGLENSEELIKKAFEITDQSQVLEYSHNSNYYLVRMLASHSAKLDEKEKENVDSMVDELKAREKRLNSEGFIASLQRAAKIETFDAMLKSAAI